MQAAVVQAHPQALVQKGHHVSGTKAVARYELVGNVAGKTVGSV